jgi:hypothetical protein
MPPYAMHHIADDRAPCAALRADLAATWAVTDATCERSVARVVRGVGIVETWRASGAGQDRWVMTIDTGRDLWMSEAVDPGGSGCGAGHGIDVDVAPSLTSTHPGGRPAAVLRLDVTTTHELLEQPGGSSSTAPIFLACGPDEAGLLGCATVVLPADEGRCTTRIDDRGTITRRCTASQPLVLP